MEFWGWRERQSREDTPRPSILDLHPCLHPRPPSFQPPSNCLSPFLANPPLFRWSCWRMRGRRSARSAWRSSRCPASPSARTSSAGGEWRAWRSDESARKSRYAPSLSVSFPPAASSPLTYPPPPPPAAAGVGRGGWWLTRGVAPRGKENRVTHGRHQSALLLLLQLLLPPPQPHSLSLSFSLCSCHSRCIEKVFTHPIPRPSLSPLPSTLVTPRCIEKVLTDLKRLPVPLPSLPSLQGASRRSSLTRRRPARSAATC